ncbi:hypothetical protein AALP_AA7G219600 [Arabis alpina]|uniref:THIF-type NAD/FAD binding fold domain-containing protein n=1 Tax=Arabis alpina TaxID=50452 RepID=A0A087GJR9_ARAAL|nr:hypothetical protein AALP_AA7G219600 [Arabis alpina]
MNSVQGHVCLLHLPPFESSRSLSSVITFAESLHSPSLSMADLNVLQCKLRDLDKLLLRAGNLVGANFDPGTQLKDDIRNYLRILVVGAGGLGCELLKDLALSGFTNLDVIDMDRTRSPISIASSSSANFSFFVSWFYVQQL